MPPQDPHPQPRPEPRQHGLSRRGVIAAGAGLAVTAGTGGLPAGPAAAATRHAGAAPRTRIPFVIDCASWGARPPADPLQVLTGTTRKIVVHHMAFPNVTDYSREHALQLARDCQNLHMDHNGWSDTGQHFTVSRGGYVLEGRHQSLAGLETGRTQVVSAHCVGENTQSIGIENEGTYTTELPPAALWNSLVRLCATICQQYQIHAYNIFGHWDWNNTDCPGVAFYREFPELRRQVAARTGLRYPDAPARTWPDIFSSSAGATVLTLQYLLLNQGYQVPTNSTFTPETVRAVQDFQRRHGLTVSSDGTVTQPTWEALTGRLNRGATGNPVKAVQSILAHKGYPVTVNGSYDGATTTAVRQLQQLHQLPPTGIVDVDTWCATLGGIVRSEFRPG